MFYLQKKFQSTIGTMSVAITSCETLESMFSGSESNASHVFECSKVNIPVIFDIPLANGSLRTLEAVQEYLGRTDTSGFNFHVLVSSSATPRYPVLASVFLQKYTNFSSIDSEYCCGDPTEFLCRSDIVSGTASPRSLPVKALRALFSGKLATSWGSVLSFCDESILVRYGKNDFSVVDPTVFNTTYHIHPEKINMRIKYTVSKLEICFYNVTFNGVGSPSAVKAEISLQVANLSGTDASNIFLIADTVPLESLCVPPGKTTGDILKQFNFLAMVVVTFISPFKNRRMIVQWPVLKELLNSPIDNDDFPDLICSTGFFLGHYACATPDFFVSIDIHNVTKMHCARCNRRVMRGKILSICPI